MATMAITDPSYLPPSPDCKVLLGTDIVSTGSSCHKHTHWSLESQKKLSMATASMLQCAFSSLFTYTSGSSEIRNLTMEYAWQIRNAWALGRVDLVLCWFGSTTLQWFDVEQVLKLWAPAVLWPAEHEDKTWKLEATAWDNLILIPWAPAWFASSVSSDGDIGGFRPCQWAILSPSSRETPWINWTCTTPLYPPWVGCQVSAT